MEIINCANTEDDAHVVATAAFDEAASSLGEPGFGHEVTRDGVTFSRSEPDVGESMILRLRSERPHFSC